MGCKTIRSSQHELVDTLNTRFWSSDIIMQARPCGFAEYQKGQKWNEMNILWLSWADGSSCSFITLGDVAECPELLEEDGWSPGGDLLLGRRQDQLRRIWAPCHLRPSSSSFSSGPFLRARLWWNITLQSYPPAATAIVSVVILLNQ